MNAGPGKAFAARVLGIVQGVGFRYATVYEAQRLALQGYVRNMPDGSVEVVAEGPEENLDRFRAWLNQGPPGAVVREVSVEERPYQGRYSRFSVEY
jgi:acylphosphatase